MKRRAAQRELPPLVFVIFAVAILYYIGLAAYSSVTGLPIGGDYGGGFGGGFGTTLSTLSGITSTTSATCSASNCAACSTSSACTGASCIWNSGSSTCSASTTSSTGQTPGSNTPPVCLNFKATPAVPFEGDEVELLVNMSDNSGLAEALFQTDFGGTTAAPWKDLQKIIITGSPKLKFSSYTWSDSTAKAGTKIKWRVIAKDINGAGTTCAEQSFTLLEKLTYTEKEEKAISTAIEGRLVSLTLANSSKHGIKKVSIFPNADIASGKLVVKKLIGKPKEVSVNPEGIIYQFYEFALEEIADTDIKNATIELKVNSSWISENEVDSSKIYLQRWTGTVWNKITMKKGTEGTDSVEYSAVSPGLSFFAVTGTAAGGGGTECSGFVKLTLPESAKAGSTVTAEISGLEGCESKSVYIRANSCQDEELGLREGNGEVGFKAPFVRGSKTFYACVDIDGDGSFSGGGEVDFASMQIETTSGTTSTTKKTTTTGATSTTAASSLSSEIESIKTDVASLKAQGKDVEIIQDIINEAELALEAGDETRANSKLTLAKAQVEKLKGGGDGNIIVFVGVGIAGAVAAGAGGYLYWRKRKQKQTVTVTETGFKGGPKVGEVGKEKEKQENKKA